MCQFMQRLGCPFQKERTDEANAKTLDCDDNIISSSCIRVGKTDTGGNRFKQVSWSSPFSFTNIILTIHSDLK
jgi:hypothetical protein